MIPGQQIVLDQRIVSYGPVPGQNGVGHIQINLRIAAFRQDVFDNALHSGVFFAVPAVLARALVPEAGVNQAVAEEKEMTLVDADIPILLCGVAGGSRAGHAFRTVLMIMGVALNQNIAIGVRARVLRFYLVVEQIDLDVLRVGGIDGVRRGIQVAYGDSEVENVIRFRRIRSIFNYIINLIRIARIIGVNTEQIAVIGDRLGVKGQFCSVLNRPPAVFDNILNIPGDIYISPNWRPVFRGSSRCIFINEPRIDQFIFGI